MIRIAIATDDGNMVSNRMFTTAKMFKIYDMDEENGTLTYVEDRQNAVASSREASELSEEEYCKLLHEKILNDVNVIIGTVCTRLTYYYFLSNNVQVLFVERDTPVTLVEEYLRKVAEEISKELKVGGGPEEPEIEEDLEEGEEY
ncbi:MAG: hypothetical protein GXO23_00485 [Crenarchaeota archaeon]|nr:hypothetical protein [Thermoproteota archaeon]